MKGFLTNSIRAAIIDRLRAQLALLQQSAAAPSILAALVNGDNQRLAAVRNRLAEIDCEIAGKRERLYTNARRMDSFENAPQPSTKSGNATWSESFLPPGDKRRNEETFNKAQSENGNTRLDLFVAGALGVACGVGIAIDTTLGYRVFSDWFAPDLPGQSAHGPIALLSCALPVASVTFHTYLHKHPDALAGKVLEKFVPWGMGIFVMSMAIMAAKTVVDSADFSLFGAETSSPDLFAEASAEHGPSLLDRIAVGAFGLGLASLAVTSFWFTQRAFDLLWDKIKSITTRRASARGTARLMTEINEDEAQLRTLDAERQALLRELESEASMEFAAECAALLQEFRTQANDRIREYQHWKKQPESVINPKEEPAFDLPQLKGVAAAFDLSLEKIRAAFTANKR